MSAAALTAAAKVALENAGLDGTKLAGILDALQPAFDTATAVVLNEYAQQWREKASSREVPITDRYRHRAAASVATDELITHNTHRASRAAWAVKNGGR